MTPFEIISTVAVLLSLFGGSTFVGIQIGLWMAKQNS